MRLFHPTIFVVILFTLVAKGDELELSFEALLEESRRSWGVASEYKENWRKWEGLHTLEGVEMIADVLTTSKDMSRRELAWELRRLSTVTHEDAARRLIERARRENDGNMLCQYFRVMNFYDESPDLLPFWASYLYDKRVIEDVSQRHPETFRGDAGRLCDSAAASLAQWLEKRTSGNQAIPVMERETER